MRTPDPAIPAATARTVPSPPAAITTAAPRETASTAWPAPGSSRVVSNQWGGPAPRSIAARSTSARNAAGSSCFDGFMTIQGRSSPSAGSAGGEGTESADRLLARLVRATAARPAPMALAPRTAATNHLGMLMRPE